MTRRVGPRVRLGAAATTTAAVAALAAHEPSLEIMESWSAGTATARTLGDVAAGLIDGATTIAEKDNILRPLVRRARDDADARLVLCRLLLPALRRMARSFGPPLDPDDVWAEVLAGFLAAAATYPLDRRPSGIASNLTLDTLASVCRWARRERAWIAHTSDLQDAAALVAHPAEPSLTDEAVSRGVVSRRDGALLAATRLYGVSLASAAQALGLSYEAAKKRRRRSEARLAAWLESDESRQPMRRSMALDSHSTRHDLGVAS